MQFRDEQGSIFDGISAEEYRSLIDQLQSRHHISPLMAAETAGYSLAMVVRFALGLSAQGGLVCVFLRDSLAGAVALTTLRHLINCGAEGVVLGIDLPLEKAESSSVLAPSLAPLSSSGLRYENWHSTKQTGEVVELLENCHNAISGMFSLEDSPNPFLDHVAETLNELHTPVHSVQAPHGLDVDRGEKAGRPLFSSSTLSLGVPFRGLAEKTDYVGRHYLADISIPPALYEQFLGIQLGGVFSSQPVIKIFSGAPADQDPTRSGS